MRVLVTPLMAMAESAGSACPKAWLEPPGAHNLLRRRFKAHRQY